MQIRHVPLDGEIFLSFFDSQFESRPTMNSALPIFEQAIVATDVRQSPIKQSIVCHKFSADEVKTKPPPLRVRDQQ
jgi:hypothetical protein